MGFKVATLITTAGLCFYGCTSASETSSPATEAVSADSLVQNVEQATDTPTALSSPHEGSTVAESLQKIVALQEAEIIRLREDLLAARKLVEELRIPNRTRGFSSLGTETRANQVLRGQN
jgi:hypothetical protein